MTELSRPAPLPALFAKSLVSARFGGSTLPDEALRLSDQRTDPVRLARYQKICGFNVNDQLPATYLHVLAFPVVTELISARSFPLPLPGLIHLENHIDQLRPVAVEEPVSLTVQAQNLRPHPRGRAVDLLTVAQIGAEEVFRERSTYLHRQATGEPAPDSRGRRSSARTRSSAGSLWPVPADIGRRYAAVSGDCNPIHLHRLSARLFGFPRAIAHGMWLAARTLSALQNRLPAQYHHTVSFKLPVLLPATVRCDFERVDADWSLSVTSADGGKPHLVGSVGPL